MNEDLSYIRYLVAEMVMGWSYKRTDFDFWLVTDPEGMENPNFEQNWWDTMSIPEYEQTEGLQVLEKMRSKDIHLQLWATPLGYRLADTDGVSLTKTVENPSLAICLGALELLGIDQTNSHQNRET